MRSLILASSLLLLVLGGRGIAQDKYSLFGIIIGDNIKKYNPRSENLIPGAFIVDAPKPNKDFIYYFAGINQKTNEIVFVGGMHKKNYVLGDLHRDSDKVLNEATKCTKENKEYLNIIANGDQFKKFKNNSNELDVNDVHKRKVYIFDGEKIEYSKKGNIKFSVDINCFNKDGTALPNEKIGLRARIMLMDHRNLDKVVSDNEEIKKKNLDKTGLQ
jgi:hypothetical protein